LINITQDTTNDLIFFVNPTLSFFLFCAQNRCESCEGVIKYFNATNLSSSDCPLTFRITEVGEGGVENLDAGEVRLNPPSSWDISLYEVPTATEKNPLNGTLLTTQPLTVIWDGDCTAL